MMGGKKPRNGREPAEPDPLGLTEPVRVIRETLFTRRHAEMLFDQVTDLLGEEAWIETRNAGTQRSVYRREAPGAQTITPWPVLKLGLGGRLSTVIPLMGPPGAPAEPPPRPGRAPRLRGLGPGEILIHDGSRSVTVTYGEDGRWFETTRSGDLETLAAVVPALAHKSAQPVELLADFVAGLDPRKSGPGLAYLPVPQPGGVGGTFRLGVQVILRALFANRIPGTARFIIADGYEGSALAFGRTREEAFTEWRKEVERLQPRPPEPKPPPAPTPEDMVEREDRPDGFRIHMTLRGPTSDVPLPEPSVENTPAALIPLAPFPSDPPPFGNWVRLIGSFGQTVHAAQRHDPDGFTLVGQHALGMLDLEHLDELLTAADHDQDPRLTGSAIARPAHLPPYDCLLRTYAVIDEATGLPITPRVTKSARTHGFDPACLDGGSVEWNVVRRRKLRE